MDKFIVLKTFKTGEADLVIHALNARGQKVSFIAKGALKSKKRFQGGILEPTHFIGASFSVSSRSSESLARLHEAHLLNGFESNRNSYEKIQLSLWVIQIIDRICKEGTSHTESLFNLTGNALKIIPEIKNEKSFKMHFLIKILQDQGLLKIEPWMSLFLKTPLLFHTQLNIKNLEEALSSHHTHLFEQQLFSLL